MKELSLYRELAKNNYRTGTCVTTMVRSPAKLSQSPGNSDRIGCPTKLARLLKRTKADPQKSGVHSPAAGVDDKLEQNLRRLLQPTIAPAAGTGLDHKSEQSPLQTLFRCASHASPLGTEKRLFQVMQPISPVTRIKSNQISESSNCFISCSRFAIAMRIESNRIE